MCVHFTHHPVSGCRPQLQSHVRLPGQHGLVFSSHKADCQEGNTDFDCNHIQTHHFSWQIHSRFLDHSSPVCLINQCLHLYVLPIMDVKNFLPKRALVLKIIHFCFCFIAKMCFFSMFQRLRRLKTDALQCMQEVGTGTHTWTLLYHFVLVQARDALN